VQNKIETVLINNATMAEETGVLLQ